VISLIATMFSCSPKVITPSSAVTEEPRIELPGYDTSLIPPIQVTEMSSINSISEIQLPLQMDSAALVKQINLLIPKILFEDNDIKDDKMKIRAEKMDSAELLILPKKLLYSVPFKLFIERDINISTIKAQGALRIYFNTDYSIHPDWSFESKTTIVKHEWIETPKVKFGPVNIPIETIANKLMGTSADLVCSQIDVQLQQGFKLREYVDLAWRKIQQPIQITDKPQLTWLMIKPEKIMMVPLNTEEGIVKTSLVFRSVTDMSFGPKPELPYAGILPTFEDISRTGKDSLMKLSLRFPLDRAEKLLRDFFIGQEFRDGNRVMYVDSLQLSGNEGKLHVKAFISGTYPAIIDFDGLPVYNLLQRRFELVNLDYSVKSKNVLVKAASWILKKNLNKKLGELLVYEVGSYIDSGKKNLQDALSQANAHGFKMKAELENIWALDPTINGNLAEVHFLANGKFRIMIEELVK
ncbi:MAG: DUF4403 family protein, partial [Saprospiraceae bacterium]